MIDSLDVGDLNPAARLSFDDERERASHEAPAGAFASVTVSSEDESWGAFLTHEETLRLYDWLGLLLHPDTTGGRP